MGILGTSREGSSAARTTWLCRRLASRSLSPPMSLIIVEGNISAGKSTLTRQLAELLNYRVFLEPTSTNPFLADFYRDPKKYALRMQVYLLRRRFHTYVAALRHMTETGEGAVLDRSIFSDWVFAEKNRLDGNIDSEGFFYYTQLREQMLRDLPFPHVAVYLDVAPDVCHARIHGLRKRAAEVDSGIPLAYLEGLHGCYGQLLDELETKGSNVLRLDWENFGSPESVRDAVLAGAGPRPAAIAPIVKELLASEELLRSRMRFRRPDVAGCDSDDDDLELVDLEGSNVHEMQAMDAPASPQSADEPSP